MRVMAVDVPAVLAVTRQVVAASGYATQFDYLSGELFTINLGRYVYGLAIAGSLWCHLLDEATNRRLLGRLFETLRPGGSMAHGRLFPTLSACCCAQNAVRSSHSRRR